MTVMLLLSYSTIYLSLTFENEISAQQSLGQMTGLTMYYATISDKTTCGPMSHFKTFAFSYDAINFFSWLSG